MIFLLGRFANTLSDIMFGTKFELLLINAAFNKIVFYAFRNKKVQKFGQPVLFKALIIFWCS